MSTLEDFTIAEWRPSDEELMAHKYILDTHALVWFV